TRAATKLLDFIEGFRKLATYKARASPSNTARRTTKLICCLAWLPIWSLGKWPSLSLSVAMLWRVQQRRRPQPFPSSWWCVLVRFVGVWLTPSPARAEPREHFFLRF